MLTLRMCASDLAELPPDLDGALEDLGEDYRRVLGPGIEAQAEALGLPSEALRAHAFGLSPTDVVVFAELLATPAGVIVVRATEPRSGRGSARLELYGVGSHEIGQLLYGLANSLSERYDVALPPYRHQSARFEELLQRGSRAMSAPSSEELETARLLLDPALRSLLRSIASSDGGLLASDISEQSRADTRDRAERARASLEASGLASAELVVTCSRSESQILRVPSRDLLEQMAQAGARCACGRPLLDERSEEAVMLTERGRRLLTSSRWMSLLLVSTLHALGVDYGSMTVEQQPASAESDCFVDIDGELCLFELKDGGFGLEDARSLGAKLGRHQPDHTILITTSPVDSDARDHLGRPQPAAQGDHVAERSSPPITYVEGTEGIVVDVGSLIESIYVTHSVDVLRQSLPFVTLDAASLVGALRAPEEATGSPPRSRRRVADRD